MLIKLLMITMIIIDLYHNTTDGQSNMATAASNARLSSLTEQQKKISLLFFSLLVGDQNPHLTQCSLSLQESLLQRGP